MSEQVSNSHVSFGNMMLTSNTQFNNDHPIPPKFWNEKGELQRPQSAFRDFISSKPGSRFPPEIGRYHLYVQYACPWGQFALSCISPMLTRVSSSAPHHHSAQAKRPRGYFAGDIRPLPPLSDHLVALHQTG